jgi:DNA (cytosine-5)-methyltransferase 1
MKFTKRNKDRKTIPLPFDETGSFDSGSIYPQKMCSSGSLTPLNVLGLFAGIGGVELGLQNSGHHTKLLCEIDKGAQAVLRDRFKGVQIHEDVRTLKDTPDNIDLITGGFPCQDLSQAGRGAGIVEGKQSSLVTEIFRLIEHTKTPYVLLENVSFMLKLDSGKAMTVLAEAFELLGYKWAYRVVNSQAFGVPQRRERVIFLASLDLDPRTVLFADEAPEPIVDTEQVGVLACGFYWTEGIRGLGWAVDSVPTLKGGSTVGIPSPPAILMPDGLIGTPDIRDAERMQGFPEDWTLASSQVTRDSHRWKLVGNAVTVNVFEWLGYRLRFPDNRGIHIPGAPRKKSGGWARSGWNVGFGRFESEISSFPAAMPRPHLKEWLKHPLKPLSLRATAGFHSRTQKSGLIFPKGFIEAVVRHKNSASV